MSSILFSPIKVCFILHVFDRLTVNEIKDDLNFRFKRITEKQNEESENDNSQEVAFFWWSTEMKMSKLWYNRA
jgi:hypothetical protein